jgi:hypothetical protein
MPDPDRLLTTVRRATDLLWSTPGRAGGVVSLAPSSVDDILVFGDLHGNLPAFRKILEIADLGRNPKRHLILQELIHGKWMYPGDRGDRSHQLIDLFSALKCQYPDRVHLILGNHELSELTGRVIGKDGEALNAKFRLGIQSAYGERSNDVYQAYSQLFAALPIAVRSPNRVLICHTLPDGIYLDQLDLGILDQNDWPPEATKRGGTVYAMTWGRDCSPETADRFAQMIDADLFVTGHQPCDEGFRQASHRQIIIDGTPPCPSYCHFLANESLTIESLLGGCRVLNLLA